MRWRGRRTSSNYEDRTGGGFGGFGGRRLTLGGGCGTVIIVIVMLLAGINPLEWFSGGSGFLTEQTTTTTEGQDTLKTFSRVVLADTEEVWSREFNARGQQYRAPTLVFFNGNTQSGCGFASSATGPFYCPADEKIYIDLSFFQQLKQRFGASGDFAMAYVIAHEVGHHVQHLMGITDQLHQQRGRISEREYNQLSVKTELQADFLAGLWAHHADRMFDILHEGDIQEALNAANAIGDDRLQQQQQGHVVPDSFTHGTSAQRMRWFSKGFQSGSLEEGDTFNAPVL